MKARLRVVLFAVVFVAVLALGPSGFAASPSSGTIGPLATSVAWQGQHFAVGATADPTACPPQAADPLSLVCDHFALTVAVDPSYWLTHTRNAVVTINWPDSSDDFDLYVFDQNGNEVDSSTQGGTTSEQVTIPQPSGTYDVVATPFTVVDSGYSGTATFNSQLGSPTSTSSPKWTVVTHGQCCEGNLAAFGSTTYVLLPELLTGNEIDRSTDRGHTWQRLYPPADVSVPFGIEGDLRAFGDDITYFGTEVAQGVAAHSDDRGDNWTIVQIPVAFVANDQAWEYIGRSTCARSSSSRTCSPAGTASAPSRCSAATAA